MSYEQNGVKAGFILHKNCGFYCLFADQDLAGGDLPYDIKVLAGPLHNFLRPQLPFANCFCSSHV